MDNQTRTPQAWQTDPEQLTAKNIQHWGRGIMTIINLEAAKRYVKNGSAFVINEQSVGLILNGKMES